MGNPVADCRLTLFVAGDGPRAAAAEANVRSFCEKHLENGYELEVVDVLATPETAEQHGILATPSLIRVEPEPPVRLIGDISNTTRVLSVLGLLPA